MSKRQLQLRDHLLRHPTGQTAMEVARGTGIPTSSVYHALGKLVDSGLVEKIVNETSRGKDHTVYRIALSLD